MLRPLRIMAWQVTGKYPFHSNEQFFKAVMDLVTRLERDGHERAAAKLRAGLETIRVVMHRAVYSPR